MPKALTSLVHSMLTRDPDERPTATELRAELRSMEPEPKPTFAVVQLDDAPTGEHVTPAPAVAVAPSPPPVATPAPPALAVEPKPTSSSTTVFKRRRAMLLAFIVLGSVAALGFTLHAKRKPTAQRVASMFAFHLPASEPPERIEPEHVEPERIEPEHVEPEHVEPEPEHVEPPKRTKPRPPKRNPKPEHVEPATPDPPRDDGACAKVRNSAKRAFKSGRHPEALRHTKDPACWNGHKSARQNLRVLSLYELGKYSACAREGKDSSDPDTLTYAKICDAKK